MLRFVWEEPGAFIEGRPLRLEGEQPLRFRLRRRILKGPRPCTSALRGAETAGFCFQAWLSRKSAPVDVSRGSKSDASALLGFERGVREKFGDRAITRARLLTERPNRRFDFGERPQDAIGPLDDEPS